MQSSTVWSSGIATLTAAASTARGWTRRRAKTTAPPDPRSQPLFTGEDRSRDAWIGRDGARRPVAVRCAFPPGKSGAHAAAWGCLHERGLLSIVSPVGVDDARRAAAQGLAATEIARALSSTHDAAAIAAAFELADGGVLGLRSWNGSASASAVTVSIDGRRVRAAHVGADRVYRLARGAAVRLTEDHSVAESYRRERGRTLQSSAPEIDAMPLHFRSALTRVLGSGQGRPDVTEHDIADDQWLIVVSHEIVLALGEVRLHDLLTSASPFPHELAERLVVAAYPARPGGFVSAAVFGAAQP